ncbi:MAG: multiheme c-type cytochrome [Campylobacterota bacterium]|nr:multiheme c-type cytochrome [Campylobacterota bacterium]
MTHSKNLIHKIIIFTTLLLVSTLMQAKYLDTKSCAECHDMIHYEHKNSMHHKSSLFSDEFHRKIKNLTTPEKYDCAICHTPGAKNLRALMTGKEQPNSNIKEEQDGVSCFYCHQITKVLETKHRNINFYSYKGEKKPTFFGNLKNVRDSNEHEQSSNEIYKNSQVCMGCHGKKYNKHKVEICNGYDEFDKTSDCIKCHMPKENGGPTKKNVKGRTQYASHEFLGIRNDDMVKKAVTLKLKQLEDNSVELTIKNKMGHDIIMQPMRLKYVETTVKRSDNIIWKNYNKLPSEDTLATFTRLFKDDKGHRVFPPSATGVLFDNNIKANSTKKIIYNIPKLQKGDVIKSQWISYVLRPSLARSLKIDDKEVTKKYLGYSVSIVIK